jgi:hypothetical protein
MSHRIFAAAAALAAAFLAPVPATAQVLGGAERDEPLARFADPICPGVVGMKVEVAEAIVGRIRQNAQEFGLSLADPANCDPNVIATFVADGKDYITRLKARQGWMFVDMSERERKALFEAPGQVRTWTRTVVRSRDGMQVSRREGLTQVPEVPMWSAHSKIYVATRRDFLAAMVLFDRDAIDGLSMFQLADYVTMRALGGESFRKLAPEGQTILVLFEEPQGAPRSLTAADRIYLQTLYSSLPNLPAALTLATVQKRVSELRE